MFHHRHELHIPAADRFKEAIDLCSPALGSLVDSGHCIELHAALSEETDRVHHFVKSRLPALVLTKLVMYICRAVNGNAYKKIILPEEIRPFGSDQGAVSLKGIMDDLSGGIFAL